MSTPARPADQGDRMSDLEKSFRDMSSTDNVFLFVPNLIGYARIFLALLSFWFMPTNYVVAAWCYILSGAAIPLGYNQLDTNTNIPL